VIFKQPLRQTEGLMRSIAGLLGVEIAVPHFTTMSRRGNGLSLPPKTASKSAKPVQLVVDSTGLKIFGKGEWLRKKHKTRRKRRSQRKLHLGLDLVSGQIDGPVDLFLADGAYDGEPTVEALPERFGSAIKARSHHPRTRS
jgi:hypothetical protein